MFLQEGLDGIDEAGVVGEDVFAYAKDGDPTVGDVKVSEDGSWDEEGLLADFEGSFGCVEVVSGFLSIGSEFWEAVVLG